MKKRQKKKKDSQCFLQYRYQPLSLPAHSLSNFWTATLGLVFTLKQITIDIQKHNNTREHPCYAK